MGLAGSVPNIGGQLLQAGVSAIVDSGQGSVTWQAWTESYDDYYQNPARPISNFPGAPGDSVAVLVCAPKPSLGHVTMINLSRQPKLVTSVSIPAPGQFIGQLELTNASPEWALEPAASQNSELLYFYEWEFRNCAASTPSQLYDLSSASTQDIWIPNTTVFLTHKTIETPTSAVVRWLGFN